MTRKIWVVLGLAAVGLFAAPGAQAYTAPEVPTIDIAGDAGDVVPGEPVTVLMEDFLPASSARFIVSGDGVDGDDIGLSVIGGGGANGTSSGSSKSVDAVVGSDGSFSVAIVFPEAATYALTAEGLDRDGVAKTVSVSLTVTTQGGEVGGGGGGLPGTGFTGRDAAVGGVALLGAGIAAIVLARRRTSMPTNLSA